MWYDSLIDMGGYKIFTYVKWRDETCVIYIFKCEIEE